MSLYVIYPLEKPFNPSAPFRNSLKIRRKVAEGFDFQTLQTVQPRVLKVRDSSFVNRQLVRAEGFEF